MKHRILELDALRGIAALSVVFFHFTLGHTQATYGFNIGCVGVDLFFIISGFVIFMTIEKCVTWKDFAISRFSRLYPAYWFCVSFTFCVLLLSNTELPFESYESTHNFFIKYLANLTMFEYYLKIGYLDGSYWTLAVELIFYFFMSLVLIFNKKNKVELYGTLALLIVLLHRYFFDFIENHSLLHTIRHSIPLLSYFPLFFSGILIYKIKFEKSVYWRWLLLLCCYGIQLYLFQKCYENNLFVTFKEYVTVISFIYCIFFIFLAGKLGFIINKFTTWLGGISYSLYLIHQSIGVNVIIPQLTLRGIPFWVAAFTAIVVVLILATCIYNFIEKPSLQFIRKKYKKAVQPTMHRI